MNKDCDVCKKKKAVGVYASSCAPVSFSMCLSCINLSAEPIWVLILAADDGKDVYNIMTYTANYGYVTYKKAKETLFQ